jgi:beta-glucosidase
MFTQKLKITVITLFLIYIVITVFSVTEILAGQNDEEINRKVETLLKEMTLEEKVGQMTQVTFQVISLPENENKGFPVDMNKLETAIMTYHVGSILNTPYDKTQSLHTWIKVTTSVQDTAKKTRLKIPVLYGIDAIHGATYTEGSTLFPQAISMAATFNRDLSRKEGEITAREVRACGIPWNFYPVMDIGRQPLWSRFWETCGEDVYLASEMGKAYIEGQQGDNYGSPDKCATCLKHYVGYSFPVNGKDRTPAWISERMIREYFLPTFEEGVKAGSPTVMINSAEVDGIPGHASYHYLTEILKGELKFEGFTVSDWEDIKRLYTRDKVASSPKEAVKIAVMAGVDMSMVPFDFTFYSLLLELVKDGEVPMERIDDAVSRILRVKFKTGIFEDLYHQESMAKKFATEESEKINLQSARESIVLAKNEGTILPLNKKSKILVTGPTANLLHVLNGGWTVTWQGDDESLYPENKLTVVKAIEKKCEDKVTFVEGSTFDREVNIEKAVEEAKNNDVILLCLGEKAYCESPGSIENLTLDEGQLNLARAMIKTEKPVILLLLEGRPRIVTEIAEEVSAVLIGMRPGMEGGRAIADILFGYYNPDGKLPFTYPRNPNGITLYDYKPIENFETNKYNPLYPFGHGLSYSTFETSGLTLDKKTVKKGETVKATVTVKNTGNIAGKETVLLYLNDVAAQVSRPNKQLKGFEKVYLNPGESKSVTFEITPQSMSFIGIENKRIIEPGEFKVFVGTMEENFVVE